MRKEPKYQITTDDNYSVCTTTGHELIQELRKLIYNTYPKKIVFERLD